MAAQVLGRAVVHDVGAQLQRPLAVRAGEGVVDRHDDVALVRQLRDGGDVDQLQQRIGRALEPDQPGAVLDGGFDVLDARRVDEREAQADALEHAVEQAKRAAVDVVAGHDVVAGVEQVQQRVLGGHAAGEGQAVAAAVERRQARFERRARRIGRARIVEALVDADFGLGVGAGLVDRHDDRAGGRVGRLADVDRARGKALSTRRVFGDHRWLCRPRLCCGDEFEQVELGDHADRPFAIGHHQRRRAAEQQVEGFVHVGGAPNGREGRVHRRADGRLDQSRVAVHAVEQRALLDRADHARVRAAVAVAFDDRQLADAVVLHGVDRRADRVARLHAHERRQLAGRAALADHLADRMGRELLEEAVRAHPFFVVDLAQVIAAGVRQQHHDQRLRVVELVGHAQRGDQRPSRPSRRPGCPPRASGAAP